MRFLLALALLGGVTAHDCPITGIISWLKEHGAEVMETLDECKDLPGLIQTFKSGECYTDKTTRDKAAIALWYAITGLEHVNGSIGELVKHSPMVEKIKALATKKSMAHAHDSADKFCGQAKCEHEVEKMRSTIGTCYASLSCNFMEKLIPFAPCKAAMSTYLESAMQDSLNSMCQSDAMKGKTVYCAELSHGWMMKDFDCYMESARAAAPDFKCTPKCQKEWAVAKATLPKCSQVVTNMPNRMMKNVKTLFQDMSKDAKIDMSDMIKHLPEHIATYDEKCGRPDEASLWQKLTSRVLELGKDLGWSSKFSNLKQHVEQKLAEVMV